MVSCSCRLTRSQHDRLSSLPTCRSRDDDTPAEEASVVVTTIDGKPVANGKTDERGLWSFARPGPGRYLIVVDAGSGHRRPHE
jgi:hypothetical protein